MNLYDNPKGILVFIILFLIWAYFLGKSCPCNERTKCIRNEFYGVQLNHLFLYVFLGFVFPSYFVLLFFIGIVWELGEHLLDKYPLLVVKYIGGCLSEPPIEKITNPDNNYIVYRGIRKPLNPIDKIVGIENSLIHGWHGSVAELIPNGIGFAIGYSINKYCNLILI
jgi:hypothetical protein